MALAPDLFHGETTEQPDEAQQKMMALNMDEAEKEVRGAVTYVLEHPKCNGNISWSASASAAVSRCGPRRPTRRSGRW